MLDCFNKFRYFRDEIKAVRECRKELELEQLQLKDKDIKAELFLRGMLLEKVIKRLEILDTMKYLLEEQET